MKEMKMNIREEAIKNLTMKNRAKLANPKKVSKAIGKKVVKDKADDVLRELAIKRLRKKGCVASRDGAVINDGKGNVQAGSI